MVLKPISSSALTVGCERSSFENGMRSGELVVAPFDSDEAALLVEAEDSAAAGILDRRNGYRGVNDILHWTELFSGEIG